MVETLNFATLALMISVGHRTRLFDVMARIDPATSEQKRRRAALFVSSALSGGAGRRERRGRGARALDADGIDPAAGPRHGRGDLHARRFRLKAGLQTVTQHQLSKGINRRRK